MTDPNTRGLHVIFRRDQINHCPGCGRSNWYHGLSLAECAFCATALPYEESPRLGSKAHIHRENRHIQPARRGRFIVNGRAA